MKLITHSANCNEVVTNSGTRILFSYSTPVAAFVADRYIRTATKYSVTTSRHINAWLNGADADLVDQSILDAL